MTDLRRPRHIRTIADMLGHENCPANWIVIHSYRDDFDWRGVEPHPYAIFWPVRQREGSFSGDVSKWGGGFIW